MLRELRTERGLSTRKAAVQSGVARHVIVSAERGKNLTVRTLERLLNFYGYELDALQRRDV
jgi:transcriptional regulator with XRE-family HTH domain